MTGLLILGCLLLALGGAPLFAVLAGIAIIAFASIQLDPVLVIIEMYRMTSQPTLLAIPLFTFAGYLLAESGAPKRLVIEKYEKRYV